MKVKQVQTQKKEGMAAGFRSARRERQSSPAAFNPIELLSRSTEEDYPQAKLKIGPPGDIYEQEADQTAEQVMSMPGPVTQRQIEEDEQEEPIQTRPLAEQITPLVQRQPEEEEEEPIQEKTVLQCQAEEEEEPIQEKSLLQRQAEEEEEPVQEKPILQGQAEGEEEPVQEKPILQRQVEEEEEPVQEKSLLQRQVEEEGTMQGTFTTSETSAQLQGDLGEAENRTGMPRPLKVGLEALSGMDLSGVRVHNNSSRPAQLNALAYTQGQNIHVAPSQEKHLPHEGWHAVQQMQGRVKPTMQAMGVSMSDDVGLEREADVMGTKALQMTQAEQVIMGSVQRETAGREVPARRLTHALRRRSSTPIVQRQPKATKPETAEELLDRQLRESITVLSRQLANSDKWKCNGIDLSFEFNGREFAPGFRVVGERNEKRRMSHRSEASFKKDLGPLLTMISDTLRAQGPGKWRISYRRNKAGRMEFRQSAPVPKKTARSAEEELEAMGIPNRKKIYAQIFKEAEKELAEAGMMVAGFALEQLVLWIVGGVFLRALGLLGKGAIKAFPHLRRALGLQKSGAGQITKAVNSLGKESAEEFSSLMAKLQRGGKLTAKETKRLDELLRSTEAALASSVPSLRVKSLIGKHSGLTRHAKNLGDDAQREVDSLLQKYLAGNRNPGIGTKSLGKDVIYLRGREGGRVFLRETAEGYVEILGKADKSNESAVIEIITDLYL